jgi:hypothetical protein
MTKEMIKGHYCHCGEFGGLGVVQNGLQRWYCIEHVPDDFFPSWRSGADSKVAWLQRNNDPLEWLASRSFVQTKPQGSDWPDW